MERDGEKCTALSAIENGTNKAPISKNVNESKGYNRDPGRSSVFACTITILLKKSAQLICRRNLTIPHVLMEETRDIGISTLVIQLLTQLLLQIFT